MTAVQTDFEPAVRQWMAGLSLGTPQRIGTIDLIPLVRAEASGEADLLAHEALAARALEVLEKDGGVVQELLARNKAPRPVVIIEGETLVGARQNRIVAHTVVVAAGKDVIVPVGCMEHGRWHFTSAQFASGASPSEWKMPREIKASVMRSRSAGRAAALDQSALWARGDQELATAEVHSSTAERGVKTLALRRGGAEPERARDRGVAREAPEGGAGPLPGAGQPSAARAR
jgi:hypothetical protein